ncbi:MAG: LCP family protein [Actinobacteria bacterium]|nr:LCP family protein [Actinomycetota bacterium]
MSSTDATVPAEIPVVTKAARRHHRRRTWPQRLLLALNIVVILGCFGAAGGLVVSRYYGNTLNRVELADPTASTQVGTTAPSDGSDATLPVGTVVIDETATTEVGAPPETFPEADPEAKNFLITGADNNACIDPNSPYAAAFGNRESMGERSDTIMIMRVDPSTKRAAVLSFPRDLWVTIAGRNSKNRINSAYVRDDPTRLLGTIYNNFGIEVDHFIQIDFCAFKTIVDGLGGVAVPFEFPARDKNTGLNVPTAGCFTFDGDHALAYVRSRKYQYQVNGQWKTDGVSDLGRVSRQQDFLRRVLSAALDRGVTDPDVARSLIKAAQENILVDRNLTLSKMLEFVGVLRNFEPGGIATYQIEAEGANVGGNSVLLPRINGDNMQAILAIFKGEAELAGAPVQVFDTTTTAAPTTSSTVASGPTTTTRGTSSTTTTTTVVDEVPVSTVAGPEENVKGIVPPKDVEC